MQRWHVLAITLVACAPANKAPPETWDPPENQALVAKIQPYQKCLDDISASVFKLADIYAQSHKVLAGLDDPKRCLDDIADAKKLEPHDSLEVKADAFGKALANVYALTKAEKDVPAVATAFADFETAQAELFDEVFTRNRAAFALQISGRAKKEGRNGQVIGDTLVLHAEDLVHTGAVKWDHLDAIDLAAYDKSLDGFDVSLAELTAFARSHPTDKSLKPMWNLVENSKRFAIAAHQLAIRAHDKVAYSDSEKIMIAAGNEVSVIGTPAALIEAYNRIANRVAAEETE